MLTGPLAAICPSALHLPLARYLAGSISGEITLMQFALHLGAGKQLHATLERLAAAAPQRGELSNLVRLAATNGGHLAQVAALAESGLVDIACGSEDPVAAIRDQFDQAVALAPEASVALYSLGSAELLDRATGEIVSRLREWRLLGPDRSVLDIGCGIGRIERALSAYVGAVTAIDVSPGMLDEARRRCRDLPNVGFELCQGRDLSGFAERSFDLVLAVDSFPYLVAADPALAARHVNDAARILRPGGTLAILNFSYRGDAEADRREVRRLAAIGGLDVDRAATRDFALWDGLTFLLTRPPHRE